MLTVLISSERGKNKLTKKKAQKTVKKPVQKKKPAKKKKPVKNLPVKTESTKQLQTVTKKDIEEYLFGHELNNKLNDAQKSLFFRHALKNQLDPFEREIHPVLYEIKEYNPATGKREPTGKYDLTIVTGYEVYIKRAEMTAENKNKTLVEDTQIGSFSMEDGAMMGHYGDGEYAD